MPDKVKCMKCSYCQCDVTNPAKQGICVRTLKMPIVKINKEKHCDYFDEKVSA